jgi:hypothetical protein
LVFVCEAGLGLISQTIKRRLERLAGRSFLLGRDVFIGFGRIFPQFHDPSELVFIVQHILAISDLAVVEVLDVNPLARLAGLTAQLWSEASSVDLRRR